MLKSTYGSLIIKKTQYSIMQQMKNSLINRIRNYYTQFFTRRNGLDMIANILQESN
jgi:hypothetical protein